MCGRRGWRMIVVWRKQDVAAHWKSLGGQVGGDVFISGVLLLTEKYYLKPNVFINRTSEHSEKTFNTSK